MRSKNRQLLPQTNDAYIQVPGRNGSFLFPRELADRQIIIDCAFTESSLADIRDKARDIAAWLNTVDRAALSFDDETGMTYKGKLSSSVDFDHIGRMGQFSLTFRCEPLAYGSEVTTNFTGDSATVTNTGTAVTEPYFQTTFTATATEWKITLGTDYCRVVHAFQIGDVLTIDFATGAVLLNGTRAMDKLDWQNSRFFSLAVGSNTLAITPTGKGTSLVKHTPKYL